KPRRARADHLLLSLRRRVRLALLAVALVGALGPAANDRAVGSPPSRRSGATKTDAGGARGKARTRHRRQDAAVLAARHRPRRARAHAVVSAFPHSLGVDEADAADRRRPVRFEVPLWLQPLFAAVFAGPVLRAHSRRK